MMVLSGLHPDLACHMPTALHGIGNAELGSVGSFLSDTLLLGCPRLAVLLAELGSRLIGKGFWYFRGGVGFSGVAFALKVIMGKCICPAQAACTTWCV